MDWLSDILKDLAISRTLVAALFISAVVMYFGPEVAPGRVPKLPAEYLPYTFALAVLAGSLLVLWGLGFLWELSARGIRGTARALSSSSLSDPEKAILFMLAKQPSEPVNLANIDYSRAPGTKLEFHQLAKGLERKGLVSINDWDDDLISLTETGRERALQIQREKKQRNAA